MIGGTMAKKYYAVKKGLAPGVYLTWAECKKNVDGFSGAVYKSFGTREEAETFVTGGADHKELPGAEREPGELLSLQGAGSINLSGEYEEEQTGAIAYVDGSYNVSTREYSYGAVIFYDGKEEHFSKKFQDPERAKMRNVAGEIEGSMCAMRYCLEREIPSIDIYYDYEGIERWCTGDWKANKEGTIAYRDFYRKASEKVRIRFRKVKGHSGDTYNDLADLLAKQAVGIET